MMVTLSSGWDEATKNLVGRSGFPSQKVPVRPFNVTIQEDVSKHLSSLTAKNRPGQRKKSKSFILPFYSRRKSLLEIVRCPERGHHVSGAKEYRSVILFLKHP